MNADVYSQEGVFFSPRSKKTAILRIFVGKSKMEHSLSMLMAKRNNLDNQKSQELFFKGLRKN